jgi:hypothetical protein
MPTIAEFEPLVPVVVVSVLELAPPAPTVIVYAVPGVREVVVANKPPAPPPPEAPPPPPATIR